MSTSTVGIVLLRACDEYFCLKLAAVISKGQLFNTAHSHRYDTDSIQIWDSLFSLDPEYGRVIRTRVRDSYLGLEIRI